MIELTDGQRQAVMNGEAIRVAVPEMGEDLVVLRASKYDSLRGLMKDESDQETVLRYSMKQGAKAARENS